MNPCLKRATGMLIPSDVLLDSLPSSALPTASMPRGCGGRMPTKMETWPRVARGSRICCLMVCTQTGRAGNRNGSSSYGWTRRHLKEVFTHLLPTWSHEPGHPHAPRPAAAGRREEQRRRLLLPGELSPPGMAGLALLDGSIGPQNGSPLCRPRERNLPFPSPCCLPNAHEHCTPTPQKQP